MKKTLIIAVMMVCSLCLAVGCGSQSSGGNNSNTTKEYGEPMDIGLTSEEVEIHGIHLRLPDNSALEQSESDANYSQTLADTSDPATLELIVGITFVPSEEQALNGASASGENYTPEAAMIHWSDLYAGNDRWTVKDKARVGGTNALVITGRSENGNGGDVYEKTIVMIPLNSGIVSIYYEDLGNRYGDVIQESINSIWVDDGEIPEIARITSPEALQAAGLREQPWEIDCESFGVYLNVPEDYTPTVQDDGSYAWVSPDGNTTISASTIDATILSISQGALESNMAQMPGFEGFDVFEQGILHDMYALKFKHKMEDDEGEAWAYVVAVSPRVGSGPSEKAIAIAVTSSSEDSVELFEVLNTLRYADGWNNGGVLDVEAL